MLNLHCCRFLEDRENKPWTMAMRRRAVAVLLPATMILTLILFQWLNGSSLLPHNGKPSPDFLTSTTTTTKRQDNHTTTAVALKKTRRTKLIICGRHIVEPIKILKNELHFEEVPWSATDWDLIYGGYMHCQPKKNGKPDYHMDAGLNKRLNDQGWSNLKPHQVWYVAD